MYNTRSCPPPSLILTATRRGAITASKYEEESEAAETVTYSCRLPCEWQSGGKLAEFSDPQLHSCFPTVTRVTGKSQETLM